MIASRRILLCALVFALVIAMVPLWSRTNVLPCMFMWRYAISDGPTGAQMILPENSFRGFPPLCLDLLRRQRYRL